MNLYTPRMPKPTRRDLIEFANFSEHFGEIGVNFDELSYMGVCRGEMTAAPMSEGGYPLPGNKGWGAYYFRCTIEVGGVCWYGGNNCLVVKNTFKQLNERESEHSVILVPLSEVAD